MQIKEAYIMAITAFKRYEQKFMLNQTQYEALIPKLLKYMNFDDNCKKGKEYSILNLYYDTCDNYLIRNSLAAPYYKEKLRLRSYGVPTSLEDKVFLEIKKKIGGIVNKRRAVLTLQEAKDFIKLGKVPSANNYMNKQVIDEIKYFLSNNEVKPTAFISYKRMAYFGKDNKDFRLTFDSNITTRREDLNFEKGIFGTPLLNKGQHLMEVKISSSVPIWLSEILSELKIYKARFSKYGTEYKNHCINREESEISSAI